MKSALKYTTLALAALLVPASAMAGWYYEATTVTESDQARADDTMTVKAWVDGPSTKVEFVDGDQSGFLAAGNYMVTIDGGENLYLVDPSEQTYSPFNLGEMMNTVGAMMEGMGEMMKMEFTDISTEKLSEGPGESILGYSTKHYQYRTAYTMNMSVMGMKQQQQVDMVQDIWITDAFDPRSGFAVWMRPDKRMDGFIEGLDELMEAEFSKVTGAPLKMVIVQNSTGSGGGFMGRGGKEQTTTTTITNEVTTLREESIPAGTFQVPAGYTETELIPEMGQLEAMQAGEQQEESDDGKKRKRPRLRDLLKGDG